LWARFPLIVAGLAAVLVLASIALVLIGPYYTARPMIQFNFVREDAGKGTKAASTAMVDATAVLNNAAPIIRSPEIVNGVVTTFELDKDSAFAHGLVLWRFFSSVRSLLGFEERKPSNRDLAEQQLMRRMTVSSDPRSYLVSVSVTDRNPE
jgi:uncharacterized protein involved in exopolysaccharide biosynthesis